LSIDEVDRIVQNYESRFVLFDDVPGVLTAWRNLVKSLSIKGKRVHDARLAAICHVNAIPAILTFNVTHFTSFPNHFPKFRVLHPANV